jgi:hypothetical protein
VPPRRAYCRNDRENSVGQQIGGKDQHDRQDRHAGENEGNDAEQDAEHAADGNGPPVLRQGVIQRIGDGRKGSADVVRHGDVPGLIESARQVGPCRPACHPPNGYLLAGSSKGLHPRPAA